MSVSELMIKSLKSIPPDHEKYPQAMALVEILEKRVVIKAESDKIKAIFDRGEKPDIERMLKNIKDMTELNDATDRLQEEVDNAI